MSDLVERNVIKSMVERYELELSNIEEELVLYEQMKGKIISMVFDDLRIRKSNGDFVSYSHVMSNVNLEHLKMLLKKKYWKEAFELTGVRSVMPTARISEWNETIENGKDLPEFDIDTVKNTLFQFFNSTRRYMAEKVDGILKSLSPNHKTNIHDQITERFIFENVVNKNGNVNYEKYELINDLRSLIKQIDGNVNYNERGSRSLVEFLYNYDTGVWHGVDGNAFKIRVYKKGTMHVELHPEIVEKMCELLSEIYPMQISNKDRIIQKKKEFKSFELKSNLISPYVCQVLVGNIFTQHNELRNMGIRYRIENYREHIEEFDELLSQHTFNYVFKEKLHSDHQSELDELLKLHGIKKMTYRHHTWYAADYDFVSLMKVIGISGCCDDYVSYQYYPTKKELAEKLIDFASFETGEERTLEPSAGQGGLACLIPSKHVECVEISKLNTKILQSKGFVVHNGDFIKFSQTCKNRYDRIVMNPPFSKCRAKLHVEQAYGLLNKGGILTAIVPASFKDKAIIEGEKHVYSQIFENEFDNAKVNVIFVRIEKSK